MTYTTTIPTAIPTPTLQAVGMVGHTVTWNGQQWKIYSVEGYDYYAFVSSVGHSVTVDFNMTAAEWKREPVAFLLPMGCKIGDGFGQEVPLNQCRRGITLRKQAL